MRDDRGRSIRVLRPARMLRAFGRRDERVYRVRDLVDQGLSQSPFRVFSRDFLLLGCVVGAGALLAVAWPPLACPIIGFGALVVLLAIGAVVEGADGCLKFGQYREEAVATYLRDRICPCCAYDLTRLEPVDGFVDCPECGAGWRFKRMIDGPAVPSEVAERRPVPFLARLLRAPVAPDVVADHRGCFVPVRARAYLRSRKRAYAPRFYFQRAMLGLLGFAAAMFVVPILLMLLSIWVRPFASLADTTLLEWSMFAGFVTGLAVLLLWTLAACFTWWYNDRRFLIAESVRLGVCPSCLVSLDVAATASDGVIECPECRAAWRIA